MFCGKPERCHDGYVWLCVARTCSNSNRKSCFLFRVSYTLELLVSVDDVLLLVVKSLVLFIEQRDVGKHSTTR